MINLTSSQLRKAADLQDKIAKLQTQLAALVGSGIKAASVKAVKKGGMSAAGRARIAAAAKLRWGKIKAAKASPKAAKPVQKKKGMSAAGRARIVAAQKARWAKIKAAKPVAPKTATKAAVKPVAAKPTQKPAKKKFVMSAAAKAKISAAAKLRWAKIKGGQKKK